MRHFLRFSYFALIFLLPGACPQESRKAPANPLPPPAPLLREKFHSTCCFCYLRRCLQHSSVVTNNKRIMVYGVIRNVQAALKYRGGWKGLLEHMYTVSFSLNLEGILMMWASTTHEMSIKFHLLVCFAVINILAVY